MCCKEEEKCCDEKPKFVLSLGENRYLTREADGKEFAEWVVSNVGAGFYKGMVEHLKYIKIHYNVEE